MHRQYSMAKKLPAIVLCICVVFGLFNWVLLSSQTSSLAKDAISDKSQSTINQLVELIRTPLFNDDTISIQVALRKATQDPIIYSASFYDVNNQLVTQSKQPGQTPQDLTTLAAVVQLQDTQAGTVYIEINSRPIYRQHQMVILSSLGLWVIFTAGSLFLSHPIATRWCQSGH